MLNLINKANKEAAKASATNYLKAVETYIVTSELDSSSKKLEFGETYDVIELNDLVELKGTKPSSGEISIDGKRNISSATLVLDGYVVNYDGKNYTIDGKNKDIYAESITIDKKETTLMKDETLQLNATIEPDNVTDKTVKWISGDDSIAKVDGNGLVTATGVGTVTITAKTTNEHSATVKINVNAYLSDVVNIGDYVAYDANNWTVSADKPSIHGNFGGYTLGNSKNMSVACKEDLAPSLKGWRVLKKDTSTKTVTLIHAGQPECYYYQGDSTNETLSIEALNNRAKEYVVSTYATSGRAIKSEDIDSIASPSDLKNIGSEYYSADITAGRTYYMAYNGSSSGVGTGLRGYRPLIELKANIITTGKGQDKVGNQNAWTLVEPKA